MTVIWWLLCGVVALVTGSAPRLHATTPTIDETIMNSYQSPQAADFIQDEDTLLVELDLLLSPEQWEERMNPNNRAKRSGLRDGNWPERTVIYKLGIFKSNYWLRKKIREAMREYRRFTCVYFRQWYPTDKDYILFTNYKGCSATLGYRGGRQIVNLAPNCLQHGIIVHELGHALGLDHEQTRPDRDHYVTVNETNIIANSSFNFFKNSADKIDTHQIPYDYLSVMHYGNNYFAIDKSRFTLVPKDENYLYRIGQSTGLSYEDIKLINLKYGCNDHCPNIQCPEDGFVSKQCTCWCKRNIETGEPIAICDTGREVPGATPKNPKGLQTCDHEVMHLSCEKGTIRIISVMYGRLDPKVCPDERSHGTGCSDPNARDTVKNMCQYKPKCDIAHSVFNASNACPHLSKYLVVGYWCMADIPKVKTDTTWITTTTPAPTPAPTICEDIHPQCDKWLGLKYCTHKELSTYVRGQCKKSCGVCGCHDRSIKCATYLLDPKACERNPSYMDNFCTRSCGKCGRRKYSRPRCRDANKNCLPWVERGMCKDNESYMRSNCAKSCGFCGRKRN